MRPVLALLLIAQAHAEPGDDPLGTAWADAARAEGWDVVLGIAELDWMETAYLLGRVGAPDDLGWSAQLAPERTLRDASGRWPMGVVVRPGLRVAEGTLAPVNLDGAEEPGALTATTDLDLNAYAGPWLVQVRPEVGLDVGPGVTPGFSLAEAWAGVLTPGFRAGFGKRNRWFGPGRHAALLVSDHAEPPPMGEVAGEGRLPGWGAHLGRFRGEVGLGWLDRPREDVSRPGLLRMDLRWRPCPAFELGATRLSLFGGVGRPPVDVGQLILPTEPHVDDDPEKVLADQNEMASLDFRLTLPLRRWTGLPVEHVEAWWQYGGEDVRAVQSAGIPYPSLAGVGNLYGGEVKTGRLALTVEHVRVLDDYFRWYTGHRVYHEGFTQDGEPLGFFAGGDAELTWAGARWEGQTWRTRASVEHLRRVGVIEALNDRLFTLMTEERRWTVGADGAVALGRAWLSAGAAVSPVTGAGFVPGAHRVEHRVWVALAPGARLDAVRVGAPRAR